MNNQQCDICEQGCIIQENGVGRCKMYTTDGTRIIERFPSSYLITTPISIETMPLVHFHPKGKFLQVSTIGCNFSCPGCVSEILARRVDELAPALEFLTPEMVVARTRELECIGIVFCLNEPAVSFYTILELAKCAHDHGLLFGCSTNGYFTRSALEQLIPYLDCVSVGLKGCKKESYVSCGATNPEIPMQTIQLLANTSVHLEIAIIHEKGKEDEIMETCLKVAKISPDIPVQIMRFIAFGTADVSFEPSIHESEHLCNQIRAFLTHVYLFNSPGSTYGDTLCPVCNKTLMRREMHGPMGAHIFETMLNASCACGYQIPINGRIASKEFEEQGMMGGYRSTRALEVIESILVCLGVTDEQTHAQVWFDMMREKYIDTLQMKIQDPIQYLEIVMYLARLTDRISEGTNLCNYIQKLIELITVSVRDVTYRPRVYYMMGTPLFCLNEGRFETKLVTLAGGTSVNCDLPRKGMPGIMIRPDDLIRMNPDIIVISGLFSCPEEDVYTFCYENLIEVNAIKNHKVIAMPVSWDFGNPRWILGLLFLAQKIHPECCSFNIESERANFYNTFFGISPNQIHSNRSFYRTTIS